MGQWDLVLESIKKSDFVIEVVDARCPKITRSGKFEKFVVEKLKKPLVIIINKSDLVPIEFAEKTRNEFSKEFPTCFVSVTKREGMEFLKTVLGKISPNKDSVAVVVGYPNVGKSSIINFLAKRRSTSVSSIPGHTKKSQIVRVTEKLKILDVPGILPPDEKFSALTSSLRPEKSKQIVKDALDLLEMMEKSEGNNFMDIYGIKLDLNNEIFEEIAIKRNYKIQGNIPDIERAARTVLYDWNSGKLTAWGMYPYPFSFAKEKG